MSVEEFLDGRFDLPESGQWSELVEGQPVHLQPPDLDHGNAILNLSKRLAEYAQTGRGYACFDLGLQMSRDPDTLWFPAVSYFHEGPRFAELDRLATETIPALVIELASTGDRRSQMPARVDRYLQRGVSAVWVIDPAEHSVLVADSGGWVAARRLEEGAAVTGRAPLEGLILDVSELFAEPSWWA